MYGQYMHNHVLLASVLPTGQLLKYTQDNWIFPSPSSTHFTVKALCAAEVQKMSYGCHLLRYCKNALLV